jgi:hypothetical protein
MQRPNATCAQNSAPVPAALALLGTVPSQTLQASCVHRIIASLQCVASIHGATIRSIFRTRASWGALAGRELQWASPLTLDSIVKYPDPKLLAPNAKVGVFGEPLKKLAAEMFDVMYKCAPACWPGGPWRPATPGGLHFRANAQARLHAVCCAHAVARMVESQQWADACCHEEAGGVEATALAARTWQRACRATSQCAACMLESRA